MVDLKIKFIWWLRYLIEFGFKAHYRVIHKELSSIQGRLLDLGCGIGNFSIAFPWAEYVGVDIDERLIEYARRHYGVLGSRRFQVADARKTGLPSNHFDAVLAIGLFHHLDDKEANTVVLEVKRVLKKNGKAIIIEDYWPKFWQNPFVYYLYFVDFGDWSRDAAFYKKTFAKYLTIKKTYPLKSGLWRYNVFVLENRIATD